MNNQIICQRISKSYGKEKVLNDLSLYFSRGLTILYGTSGSGKTTLLNIICGLIDFNGKIMVNNTIYENRVVNKEVMDKIAYITQDNYFIDYLTVKENLLLCQKGNKDTDSLLKKFSLFEVKDQYPKKLSGGEQERVAIIASLLQEKEIFIFDEPTASLDSDNKKIFYETLNTLKREKIIICSTHDEEVLTYADKVIDFNELSKYQKKSVEIKSSKKDMSQKKKEKNQIFFLYSFIKKQRHYKEREKKSKIILIFVVIITLLLCFLCSDHEKKLEHTLIKRYKLNYLPVTCQKENLDTCLSIIKEKGTSYDYNYQKNFPKIRYEDGAIIPEEDYEFMATELPFERHLFPYQDQILYGTYFKEEKDILISYEKAQSLSNDLKRLIGTNYEVKLPNKLETFKIVGIFGPVKEKYKNYLKVSHTIYDEMVYINGDYLKKYYLEEPIINDEIFFNVYFKNTKKMQTFYDQFKENSNNKPLKTSSLLSGHVEFATFVISMQYYLYPIILLAILLAIAFYFQTKIIEAKYNSHIYSTYEYYGYSLKDVILANALYFIMEVIRSFLIALIISVLIYQGFNTINDVTNWTQIELFYWDTLGVLAIFFLLLGGSLISSIALFFALKTKGWYQMLKRQGDLL